MMDLIKYNVYRIINDRMVKCIWEVEEKLQGESRF